MHAHVCRIAADALCMIAPKHLIVFSKCLYLLQASLRQEGLFPESKINEIKATGSDAELSNQTATKRKRVHFSLSGSNDNGDENDTSVPTLQNTSVDDMLRDLTNLSEDILADSD